MILHKYRVWCTTEAAWQYTDYRESAPTVCPANAAHSIDTNKTAVVGTEGTDAPHADDLKPYVTPDLFPLGYFMVHAGVGDDVANGAVGGGVSMKAESSSEGDTTVTVQFIHHVLLAGGSVQREAGEIDDYINLDLIAPATVGTSNPGAGAFDKLAVGGGLNMFIPNATVTGDWDLNLTEKLNANVDFTKAVPVPASGGTGFFDYDVDANVLTFNAGQTGSYNLFDADVPLSRHVNEVPLLGNGEAYTTVPAVKPALCLPHWKFKTTMHHGPGTHALKVVWSFTIGRKQTT
jgi:hypothetical protein